MSFSTRPTQAPATCLVAIFLLATFSQETFAEGIQKSSRQKIAEYTDNDYDYVFQFPTDWKMKKAPEVGDSGEIRVLLQGPICTVSATISKIGTVVTAKQFKDHPNRDKIAESMMNLTVEEVYKKASKEVHATRMVVAEKEMLPSDSGIKFYISTLHFAGEKNVPMGLAGIHLYPFNKDYLINFVMGTPLKDAKEENETCDKVFNSFHLVGEKFLPPWEWRKFGRALR